MSDEIKVGDNVMVIYPTPCGCIHKIGVVFKVTSLAPSRTGYTRCGNCNFRWKTSLFFAGGYESCSFITARLKKIDPPATGDTLPTRADLPINEPA